MAIGSRNKSRRQAQRDRLRSRRCAACGRYKRVLQFPQRDPKHCVECYGKLDKGLLLNAPRWAMAEMLCKSSMFHNYMGELAISHLKADRLSAMEKLPREQIARDAILSACGIEAFRDLRQQKAASMFDMISSGFNRWVYAKEAVRSSALWR